MKQKNIDDVSTLLLKYVKVQDMNKFELIAQQIIPFVCDNPECRHEYDLESLRNAADYLGLIYLSRCEFGRFLTKHGVEYNIIGITCRECWQTTLKQCHFPIKGSPKDYIYKSAQKDLSHNDLMTRVINIGAIKIHGISFFFNKLFFGHDNSIVPFSAKILADLSLISREDLKNAECVQKNKYIIDQTPILNYPNDILNELPYCFDELNIPTLLALENKRKFKIFPRFVSAESIYWYTDKWLSKSSINEISSSSLKVMIDQFDYTLSFGCYKHNALTKEELRKYGESPPPFERGDFEDYFPIFLNEYKLVRNKIDFEKIGYLEFINKYARKFYPQMLEVSSEIEKKIINPPKNESIVNEGNVIPEKIKEEDRFILSDHQKLNEIESKQRTSTIIADKCRKKASELWEKYPELDSTGEMAIHPEIEKIGGSYTVKQRQRWISSIAPDYAKRPGVRPKRKK